MIRITGKTQADGAFPVDFPSRNQSGVNHVIQVTVRDAAGDPAVPAAGTLTVKVRTPGGGAHEDMPDNQIDLTSRAAWILPLYEVPVESLELTPDSLDGDKTYDVAINSWHGGA